MNIHPGVVTAETLMEMNGQPTRNDEIEYSPQVAQDMTRHTQTRDDLPQSAQKRVKRLSNSKPTTSRQSKSKGYLEYSPCVVNGNERCSAGRSSGSQRREWSRQNWSKLDTRNDRHNKRIEHVL